MSSRVLWNEWDRIFNYAWSAKSIHMHAYVYAYAYVCMRLGPGQELKYFLSLNITHSYRCSLTISCLSYGVVWAGLLQQLSKLVLLKWSNTHSFVSHLFIVVSSLREFSVKLLIEIWLTSVYCIVYSQFAMQKKEIPMWGIKSRPHR